MRIAELQACAYTVPTGSPEADGTLGWDATTLVLVRLRSGDLTGIGWTYAPQACAALVRELLEPVVVGRDVLDVTAGSTAMFRAVRNANRAGLVSYAVSAVDIAWWDLKARSLGLPLHRLLGTCTDRVPVYGSGGFTNYTDDQLTGQLTDWGERGIPRVKIKIAEHRGAAPERDLARVRLTRRVAGPDTAVYVDANGGYRRKQAIRVGRALDDAGVTWFEEPVSSDDLTGLAQVRAAVGADVAAGEYGWGSGYVQRMCAADAVDCVQLDITRCGGVTAWLRAAAVAAAHGLEVSGHCAPHGHAAAAAATPNLRHLEWFHDHVRLESLLFDGVLDPRDGWIRPREEPGIGVALRESDAEKYRVA